MGIRLKVSPILDIWDGIGEAGAVVLMSQFSGGWARTFKKSFFSFKKQGKAVHVHAALLLSQCLSLGARVLEKQSFHVSPAKVKLPAP